MSSVAVWPWSWAQPVGRRFTTSTSAREIAEPWQHAVHARIERRDAGDALEDGERVAGAEDAGEPLARQHAAREVVGRDHRGLARPMTAGRCPSGRP